MPEAARKPIGTLLQPMDRITEILFSVIMTLAAERPNQHGVNL
jgi:hypothetical protein